MSEANAVGSAPDSVSLNPGYSLRSQRIARWTRRIAIILEEYKALRAEVLQKNSVLVQILVVGGTVSAGILGAMIQYSAYAAGFAMISAILALVSLSLWVHALQIRVVARRLRKIEMEINDLAGGQLLKWETDHGLKTEGPQRVTDIFQLIKDTVRRVRLPRRRARS